MFEQDTNVCMCKALMSEDTGTEIWADEYT
jgi:hypothetical protein